MSRSSFMLLACVCLSCSAANSGNKAASASDADQSSPSASAGTEGENGASASEGASDGDEQKLPPGPSCLNQQGDVQECLSDTDCCKNFYCGIDPDGSTRQKVCLFGG
ncbi:MAG: hypothetical protein QM784_00020 [Polyangiaceae bacterium]